MAYKINDLTALGRNLDPTDELEVSLTGATGSRKITGAQIIASAGLPAWVETNATDLTLWNNGKGNIASNTSFGDGALKSNTTGAQNTAYGLNALSTVTSGSGNLGIGWGAGKLLTGSSNTAVGNFALEFMSTGVNENTAIGQQALRQLNDGTSFRNVAVGSGSIGAAVIQVESVAVGTWSILSNSGGGYNVAIGKSALQNGGASTYNTIVGWSSGDAITTGTQNTSVGANALGATTTGADNTAIGNSAGSSNTTGIRNIFIGNLSGAGNTTGASNTVIGNDTNTGNFSSSVIIGRGATATGNNQFVVGSAGVNAGTVTTESLSSTKTWSVIINGVAQKILLA